MKRFLLVPFVLLMLGCGLVNQTVAPTETIQSPPTTAPVTETATTALATETPTPGESSQAISPLLTYVPGISTTLTAVFLTPGAQSTIVAQQTMVAATEGVQLKSFSKFLDQCPDPSDPPTQTWVNVPVMPQATAGQRVDTLVGSYYCFRAPVSGTDVETFYKEKLAPPNWALQADANGTMQFFGLSQSGIQMLFVTYGPSNKNDMLVSINVTGSMSIPTIKP